MAISLTSHSRTRPASSERQVANRPGSTMGSGFLFPVAKPPFVVFQLNDRLVRPESNLVVLFPVLDGFQPKPHSPSVHPYVSAPAEPDKREGGVPPDQALDLTLGHRPALAEVFYRHQFHVVPLWMPIVALIKISSRCLSQRWRKACALIPSRTRRTPLTRSPGAASPGPFSARVSGRFPGTEGAGSPGSPATGLG